MFGSKKEEDRSIESGREMNGEVLQQCEKVKYLGVTIDNQLCCMERSHRRSQKEMFHGFDSAIQTEEITAV